MRNFLNTIGERLAEFMQGRNGLDKLASICVIIALIFLGLELFTNTTICTLISLVFLTYALFRCYSRNTSKRAKENDRFEAILDRFRRSPRQQNSKTTRTNHKTQSDANHLVFRCEKCGQSLSVPKGKGKIKITCPRCHNEIIKKT